MTSASEELARRRAVRSSLAAWAKTCGFSPARHHRLIIAKLEAVARGEVKRLMIFMPPGSAKSTYSSILFAPWFMARTGKSILACSHTVELSEKWGRRIRSLVLEHGTTLGSTLSEESAAAGRWGLANGAEYFAAGTGTAIVGFRASGGVIIDDPIKGAEDAASATARAKTLEWYRSEVTTRLTPGAFVVLIMTRWNLDDLAGRLLQEEPDDWEVLSIPAQAEAPNDPLGREVGGWLWDDDPSYAYGKTLREQKATLPPMTWASLYQQSPVAESGNFFKADWLKTYHHAPARDAMKTYVCVDLATSEGKGDYTAIVAFGLDPAGDIFVLDVWRRQASPDVSVDALLDMVRDFKPLVVVTEVGGLKNAIGAFLKDRMNQRRIYAVVETVPSRHSKEIRAQSIAGRMAVRGLYLPAQACWLADFVSEILSFPAGRNDDQVDCCSLLGQLIADLAPGDAPKPPKPKKVLSTDPALCTVTLSDLFEQSDRKYKHGSAVRIA
jgi:predicted phage terminase large subunit-like protein